MTDRTVRSGPASADVLVMMMRRLSLPEHGAVELLIGLALIAGSERAAGGLLAAAAATELALTLGTRRTRRA